jgi:hypothetical protein
MSQAIEDVIAERLRQINKEGWTEAHDDEHDAGDLCCAGAAYALNAGCQLNPYMQQELEEPPEFWPWYDDADISGGRGDCPMWGKEPAWWKPTTPRRDMVKAAALIIAEIERLDRNTP